MSSPDVEQAISAYADDPTEANRAALTAALASEDLFTRTPRAMPERSTVRVELAQDAYYYGTAADFGPPTV